MIIGLDLSLTHTGWVIIDKHSNVIDYGTIIPKKLRKARRLNYIRNELLGVLKKYNPNLAVIEGYAYSPNANMAFSIGENGGVIKLLLFKRGINYLIVAPKTLKKFVTENGNATKEQMWGGVKKKWGIEFNTEHEVDAYGLAKVGEGVIYRDWSDMRDKELEAVKTVAKDVSKQNEKA